MSAQPILFRRSRRQLIIRAAAQGEILMVRESEIRQAIAAHDYWKGYLRNAIRTGRIDMPVEAIRSDSQCVFGKWLDGAMLTSQEESAHHLITIKERHAEFHQTAASVVELILAGKKSDAEKMMSIGGEYAKISAELTLALREWMKQLH